MRTTVLLACAIIAALMIPGNTSARCTEDDGGVPRTTADPGRAEGETIRAKIVQTLHDAAPTSVASAVKDACTSGTDGGGGGASGSGSSEGSNDRTPGSRSASDYGERSAAFVRVTWNDRNAQGGYVGIRDSHTWNPDTAEVATWHSCSADPCGGMWAYTRVYPDGQGRSDSYAQVQV